jgi:hypothetical protein
MNIHPVFYISFLELVLPGVLLVLVTEIEPINCYEHTRDQGTLGSVASCRHGRTPGRTYGFFIYKKRPWRGPDSHEQSHVIG